MYFIISYLCIASAHEVLFTRIECVGRLFMETPSSDLINSSIASDFMKTFQELNEQQRTMIVSSYEADDLLTKLMFIIAPVSRIAESLVKKRLIRFFYSLIYRIHTTKIRMLTVIMKKLKASSNKKVDYIEYNLEGAFQA